MRAIQHRNLIVTLIALVLVGPIPAKAGPGNNAEPTPYDPNSVPNPVNPATEILFFHPEDYALECTGRDNAGTHIGNLVLNSIASVEDYKCTTKVIGNVTIELDWDGHMVLPWLHIVSGNVVLVGHHEIPVPRLPRLYQVDGEIVVDGSPSTEWTLPSLTEHDQTLAVEGKFGASLHGFDNLVELAHLDLFAPNSPLQFLAIYSGLEGLEVVGSIDMTNGDALAEPDFLTNLEVVEGNVDVHIASPNGYGLYGLSNIVEIQGDLEIYLYDAWNVGYATGLEGLKKIGGDFIWNSSGSTLFGLDGLQSLEYVGGDFEPPLAVHDLGGLENLTEVGGNLTLTGSIDPYQDLSPLSSLENVGGKLTVDDFDIVSLNGLQTLQSVGSLRLHDNMYLGSVAALSNVSVSQPGTVQITQNNPLTTCQANSLVGDIQQNGWTGTATVSGNQYCVQLERSMSSRMKSSKMRQSMGSRSKFSGMLRRR